MADKQQSLSIIIRTVDNATAGLTAGINAVNKRLDEITKPTRDLKKALGEFGDKSGFNAVRDGFHGVGEAVGDLVGKVALVGGVVGLAVHGVMTLVDEFDNMGDLAERLGVSVDFLSSMRYAAERSGASVESLDQGMTSFGESMGQLRAGGGKMVKFLSTVSPALLTQLKATKGNEEAFLLLADAMEKISDPQKRLALAKKTVGDSALAPLLARGSKGVGELRAQFIKLAGSQEEAAQGAGKVDDSLKDLHAATQGIKAALLTGLSPAIKQIVEDMTHWVTDHREDIRQWADDIGRRLPGAVHEVVTELSGAIESVSSFVEGIGGWKVAAVGIAAVISGPLLSAIATLSTALLATPFGWVVASVAAVTAGVTGLALAVGSVKDAITTLKDDAAYAEKSQQKLRDANHMPHDEFIAKYPEMAGLYNKDGSRNLNSPGVTDEGRKFFAQMHQTAKPEDFLKPFDNVPPFLLDYSHSYGSPQPAQVGGAHIKVEFSNVPKGVTVNAKPQGPATVDLTTGHQFGY